MPFLLQHSAHCDRCGHRGGVSVPSTTKSPVEELVEVVQEENLPQWMVPVVLGLAAVSSCVFLAGCFFSAKIAAGFLVPQTLVDPLMYLEEASSAGARLPPSRCSLCLCPPCAISGYETGDLLLGACRREALFSWIPVLGSLYALFSWQPREENLQGVGSQRTVRWPLATSSLVGSACAISFWESGDMITGLCRGDARRALCNMVFLCPMAWPCHARWAWAPQIKNFRRTSGTVRDDLVGRANARTTACAAGVWKLLRFPGPARWA